MAEARISFASLVKEESAKCERTDEEFKTFINRGNAIELAVGVIIGGAFTAIVTALTSQILTPFINWLIGLIGGTATLEQARTVLGSKIYMLDDMGNKVIDWEKTNYIDWGAFVSAVINFFLVALVLFIIIKIINTARESAEKIKALEIEKYYEKHPEERPQPKEPAAPAPTEAELLTEIRDLLKKENK